MYKLKKKYLTLSEVYDIKIVTVTDLVTGL